MAGIQNEAAVEGGDTLVLTLKVPLETFRDAVEAMDKKVVSGLEANSTMLKQLAATMEDDLDTWFGRNGGEWLEEGLDQNVYDEFVIE